MAKLIIILLITGLCALPQSGRQKSQIATTESGRKVILLSDGSWKYADTLEAPAEIPANYTEKQRAAFGAAVLTLRKLGDGISFGINYRDYARQLGEAKSVLEDAESVLPDDSLRASLLAVWKCHIKAFGWWDTLRTLDGIPLKPGELDDLKKELPYLKPARTDAATREEILSASWIEAAEKLKPLVDLVK